MRSYILEFGQISMNDGDKVGGKNASLGEMFTQLKEKGIKVPDGFATTAAAYWDFLDQNNIRQRITDVLKQLDIEDFSNLEKVGKEVRSIILNDAEIPGDLKSDIKLAYKKLREQYSKSIGDMTVAVRSSATAEDLPTASFAGQLESYLNIASEDALLKAVHHCYASLFTNRAIKYRVDNGFEHMHVALSVGVQIMVRAGKGCSGVGFTLDPESGFKNVIVLDGVWGLGENIVQGRVTPDEFAVFKPSLKSGKKSIISKKLGAKEKTLEYADQTGEELDQTTYNFDTPKDKRDQYVLNDKEVTKLAEWCLKIEEHYKRPMDIEWAKDGITDELFIVQARPETVHASKKEKESHTIHTYELKEKGKVLATGIGLGGRIASGKARILNSPEDSGKLQPGEVLVTDITNPDWDPIMHKAGAIITNKGGRTSHAAIVAREIGALVVVGTGNATEVIKDGQELTISCAEGQTGTVYDGVLKWEEHSMDTRDIQMPSTEVMLILGDPGSAFQQSFLPNNGVGLMRLEFIINNSIKVHPEALVNFKSLKDKKAKKEIDHLTRHYKNKTDYFTDHLSQAVGTIAAAFYPRDVIVRMSDFKSNEYANLLGGKEFEPHEENPMLGFRGASRYYSDEYKEGFRLECEAMKIVRNEMGLTNVKLMIPFCRTPEEGRKVLSLMADYGLKQGENELEIYTMIEIPSNVIVADQFAEIFDGFSIGSNDLTQLTLGLDRDSALVNYLFDERHDAVKKTIEQVIKTARQTNTKIGLCGQAPSDFPEFAQFLVEQGINSISFNADALLKGIQNINEAEKKLQVLTS